MKQAISGFLSNGLDRSLAASGTVARGNESVKFSGEVAYSVKRAVHATFEGTPALMVADTFGGTFSVSGQPIELGSAVASAGPRSGYVKFRVVSVSTDDTGETIGTASRTYLIKADGALSISEIQTLATRNGITTRLTAN
ncbi:MAG: hypothetical protein NTW15_17495 [Burkholderiales bacterium]|nr:hypothetical protein [Burkholderiales bacterium]